MDEEYHYNVMATELLGHISYSGEEQLYDERSG